MHIFFCIPPSHTLYAQTPHTHTLCDCVSLFYSTLLCDHFSSTQGAAGHTRFSFTVTSTTLVAATRKQRPRPPRRQLLPLITYLDWR
ncbi:hypothetical protein DEO72_LG5g1005 [Vigna unguiculata]|uniref:Uncharacterized protein n=1 Tax=Vigna unguiculata TaxID=3917 RepID=A0A4D6LY80_VIGUN|nr:hypothetical protein DEO72_LG5g1005 [Vigna unguiculata]